MTPKDYKAMLEEYKKSGKFTEFVNKAIKSEEDSVESVCMDESTFEFFNKVVDV